MRNPERWEMEVMKLKPDAVLPSKSWDTRGEAYYFYAGNSAIITPKGRVYVETNIAVSVERGYYLRVGKLISNSVLFKY